MPKLVDHDRRRQDFAEAVWRTIERTGLDAATIREVAAEAGVSAGLLAHYFRDKDDLLTFALNLASRRAGLRMQRASEVASAAAALRGVIAEALPLDEPRRLEWRVWLSFWGAAVANPSLANEQNQRYAAWRLIVTRLLQRLRRSMPADECDRTVDTIVGLVDGLGVQAMLDPARMTPHHQRAVVEELLVRFGL